MRYHNKYPYSYFCKVGGEADGGGGLLGLPETENELDNLTEFNTAQNRWALVSSTAVDTDPSFLTTDSEN